MKKYKKCKYCGDPVIVPFKQEFHLACYYMEQMIKTCQFDTKDITFTPNKQD